MTRPRSHLQTITLRKRVNRLCEGVGNSWRSYISFVIILQTSVAFFASRSGPHESRLGSSRGAPTRLPKWVIL